MYGAMNKERKRPIMGTKLGPTGETEYISKYLYQAVPVHRENPKRIRLTGARVLTSDEAMQLVQEREDEKKQKQLEKEKRKAERESRKKTSQKEQTKLRVPVQKSMRMIQQSALSPHMCHDIGP